MEKLKVGDKLYREEEIRWSSYTHYSFATVERLTNTQAVLSNGTKLINEPKKKWGTDALFGFGEYGDKWNVWYHETPEIIEKAAKEKKRLSINNWFSKQQFTDEQKEIIYNTLNPTTP